MSTELALVPQTGEIVRRHEGIDSWIEVVSDYIKLAEYVCTTEFVPRGLRGNVPATTAAMLYGREVGLDVMTALSQISVIEGRPGLSAEAMRGLALAAGHEIVIDEATSARCVIRGRRQGGEWSKPYEWTIDQARQAGLAQRDPWRKYPRRMLIARASTDLCRDLFADVIHGFRSVEEIADLGDEPAIEEAPEQPTRTRVARKPRARKIKPETAGDVDPPSPAASPPEADSAPPPPEELAERPDSLPPIAPPLEPEPAPTEADAAVPAAPEAEPPLPVEDLPEEEAPARRRRDDDPLPLEEPIESPFPSRISRPAVEHILLHFDRMGLRGEESRAERLMLTGRIVGRELESTNDLSPGEGEYVLATLRVVKSLGDLRQILEVVEERAQGGEPDDR